MTKFQKTKTKSSDNPNPTGPKYRISSSFRGNIFGSNKFNKPGFKFNPSQFKTQHKGG